MFTVFKLISSGASNRTNESSNNAMLPFKADNISPVIRENGDEESIPSHSPDVTENGLIFVFHTAQNTHDKNYILLNEQVGEPLVSREHV